MRDKTKSAVSQHLAALKPTDRYILLGDSHSERLVWKHPELAPLHTWICGVGGDTIQRLLWRVRNDEGTGYADAPAVDNDIEKVVILIGNNDLKDSVMKADTIQTLVLSIEKMVGILKARWPAAEVVVLPLLPMPCPSDNKRSNYDRMNELLIESALATMAVDWGDITDEDFADHAHLNDTGYTKFLCQLSKLGLKSDDSVRTVKDSRKTLVEQRISQLNNQLEEIRAIKKAVSRNETVELAQIELVDREEQIEKELQELREW